MSAFDPWSIVSRLRADPRRIVELLKRLEEQIPPHVEVHGAPTVVSSLEVPETGLPPTGFQAEFAAVLTNDEGEPVYSVAVTVLRERDDSQLSTWLQYEALLSYRDECPSRLIVLPARDGDAQWIDTMSARMREGRREPLVLSPDLLPPITCLEDVRKNPALAYLTCLMNAEDDDAELGARVAYSALRAFVMPSRREEGAPSPEQDDTSDESAKGSTHSEEVDWTSGLMGLPNVGFLGLRSFEAGRVRGRVDALECLLRFRFGTLPGWATGRIENLQSLEVLARVMLLAHPTATLEQILHD